VAPVVDGTRELVFEPLEFLEKLAAITPRPEVNLLICHDVLAPRARWRRQVVTYGRPDRAAAPAASSAGAEPPSPPSGPESRPPRYWSWAALMHRAFAVDVLACPRCGGRLRLIAMVHDPHVIQRILAHRLRSASGQSPGPRLPYPALRLDRRSPPVAHCLAWLRVAGPAARRREE
jgi:hypothetical protein